MEGNICRSLVNCFVRFTHTHTHILHTHTHHTHTPPQTHTHTNSHAYTTHTQHTHTPPQTHTHTNTHPHTHTHIQCTLHYITLHCFTLYSITLHYITFYYVALHSHVLLYQSTIESSFSWVGPSVCASVCRIFWLLSAYTVTPFLFHRNLQFVNNSTEQSSAWEFNSSMLVETSIA
jgi:hypothetical protein